MHGAYPLTKTLIEARSDATWTNPAKTLLESFC
jgi:hypothetical protein